MKTVWTVAVLLVSAQGSLFEFGRMIKEETGKAAFPSYTSYGCYCGLGGRGRPRDATDRCCLMHDCCYENLTDCHTKTDSYQYSRKSGVILCEGDTWCKKQICECDKAAAVCLRESLGTYNKEYQFYVDSNCKEGPKKCEVSAGQKAPLPLKPHSRRLIPRLIRGAQNKHTHSWHSWHHTHRERALCLLFVGCLKQLPGLWGHFVISFLALAGRKFGSPTADFVLGKQTLVDLTTV